MINGPYVLIQVTLERETLPEYTSQVLFYLVPETITDVFQFQSHKHKNRTRKKRKQNMELLNEVSCKVSTV